MQEPTADVEQQAADISSVGEHVDSEHDDAVPYNHQTIGSIIGARVIWLQVFFVGLLLTAVIMAGFEATLKVQRRWHARMKLHRCVRIHLFKARAVYRCIRSCRSLCRSSWAMPATRGRSPCPRSSALLRWRRFDWSTCGASSQRRRHQGLAWRAGP